MKKQLLDKFRDFLDSEKDKNSPNLELNSEEVVAMSMLIMKADRWDKLDDEIGEFYEDEDEEEGNLCDIGEACAIAFGYL